MALIRDDNIASHMCFIIHATLEAHKSETEKMCFMWIQLLMARLGVRHNNFVSQTVYVFRPSQFSEDFKCVIGVDNLDTIHLESYYFYCHSENRKIINDKIKLEKMLIQMSQE